MYTTINVCFRSTRFSKPCPFLSTRAHTSRQLLSSAPKLAMRTDKVFAFFKVCCFFFFFLKKAHPREYQSSLVGWESRLWRSVSSFGKELRGYQLCPPSCLVRLPSLPRGGGLTACPTLRRLPPVPSPPGKGISPHTRDAAIKQKASLELFDPIDFRFCYGNII